MHDRLDKQEGKFKLLLDEKQSKSELWAAGKILVVGVFAGLLPISAFYTASFFKLPINTYAKSYVQPRAKAITSSDHPASIPWLQEKSECEHSNSNRTWGEGKCWDYEHNPMF
jgi:hypothetical protein